MAREQVRVRRPRSASFGDVVSTALLEASRNWPVAAVWLGPPHVIWTREEQRIRYFSAQNPPHPRCDARIMPGFETSRGIDGQSFAQNPFDPGALSSYRHVDPASGRFPIASRQ